MARTRGWKRERKNACRFLGITSLEELELDCLAVFRCYFCSVFYHHRYRYFFLFNDAVSVIFVS